MHGIFSIVPKWKKERWILATNGTLPPSQTCRDHSKHEETVRGDYHPEFCGCDARNLTTGKDVPLRIWPQIKITRNSDKEPQSAYFAIGISGKAMIVTRQALCAGRFSSTLRRIVAEVPALVIDSHRVDFI